MAYATPEDVQDRMLTTMSADQLNVCGVLLDDIAALIDSYNTAASADIKKVVSCEAAKRMMASMGGDVPMGATTGSMSAMGYSQSWTFPTGGTGEIYLSKTEKKLLGVANRIGSYSPIEEMAVSE